MNRIDFFSQNRSIEVEKVLKEWNECKEALGIHFKNRDSEKALPLMERAIKLFEEFIFISNGLIQGSGSIKDCKTKPVNVEERLDFIVSRPKLFHSFKQLVELFDEQEKQFAKQAALYRAKKTRPD